MKGVIIKIEGEKIFIAPEQVSCFGCMNKKCHKKQELIRAVNRNGLELSQGQVVDVVYAKISLARQSAAALLPLFIGFAAGFFLVRLIFPLSSDGLCASAGVACLFIAAFIVYFVRKRFPAKGFFFIKE